MSGRLENKWMNGWVMSLAGQKEGWSDGWMDEWLDKGVRERGDITIVSRSLVSQQQNVCSRAQGDRREEGHRKRSK